MAGAGDILVTAGNARWPCLRAGERLQVGSSKLSAIWQIRKDQSKLGKTRVRPHDKNRTETHSEVSWRADRLIYETAAEAARLWPSRRVRMSWTESSTPAIRDLAIDNVERDSSQFAEVRSALRRVNAGAFGFCVGCAEKINPKRLAAVPLGFILYRLPRSFGTRESALERYRHIARHGGLNSAPAFARAARSKFRICSAHQRADEKPCFGRLSQCNRIFGCWDVGRALARS